jgi:hypothetical protein
MFFCMSKMGFPAFHKPVKRRCLSELIEAEPDENHPHHRRGLHRLWHWKHHALVMARGGVRDVPGKRRRVARPLWKGEKVGQGWTRSWFLNGKRMIKDGKGTFWWLIIDNKLLMIGSHSFCCLSGVFLFVVNSCLNMSWSSFSFSWVIFVQVKEPHAYPPCTTGATSQCSGLIPQ